MTEQPSDPGQQVRVSFLLADAYKQGGRVKTTFNLAGSLAKRPGVSVEIVSVLRPLDSLSYDVPDRVRFRTLVDRRAGRSTPSRWQRWMMQRRSRFMNERDTQEHAFDLYTDLQLLKYLRSTRDGVVISTKPGINLALAAFGHSKVLRVGQEHFHLDNIPAERRGSLRRYYGRLDLLTTLTVGDRDAYRRLLGDRPRIVCMPNGVQRRAEGPAEQQSEVVVAAGRYTGQKGFGDLIRAFARVSREHPDWELRIFGDGPLAPRLQSLIDRRGVGDRVHLMGYTRELDKEMQRAAFLAMSSRYEGLPMVLLEALALGLPAVSYDCPTGPRDVIETGRNGILVRAGRQRELADAMLRMIALGPTGRQRLGRGALETAERFSIESISDHWYALLTQSMAERRRPTLLRRLRRAAGLVRRGIEGARATMRAASARS